jgi:hypothetical protein
MPNDIAFFDQLIILLGKSTTFLMLISVFLALYKKKYLNKPLKIFFWYCIAKFAVNLLHQTLIWATGYFRDIAVPLLNKWHITDTNFMGILSYLSNFALLGWYFYCVIPHKKIAEGVRWLSTCLFIAAIIDYLFIGDFRDYGVFCPAASSIFCFVLPLIHFWFLYREETIVPLSKNPYFWISLGLLIPNLVGCFLHFTGSAIYSENFTLFTKISIGKMILEIIGQIFLAIGFYHARFSRFLPIKKK